MKQKMPIRTQTLEHDGFYKGFSFEARVNPPLGKFVDAVCAFDGADMGDVKGLLEKLHDLTELIVVSWNYVDEKGKPIPCTREGFKSVPVDLLQQTISKAREAIENIPLLFNEASLKDSTPREPASPTPT